MNEKQAALKGLDSGVAKGVGGSACTRLQTAQEGRATSSPRIRSCQAGGLVAAEPGQERWHLFIGPCTNSWGQQDGVWEEVAEQEAPTAR